MPFNVHKHKEKTLHCELMDMRPILGAREERKLANRKPGVSPPNLGTSVAPRLGGSQSGELLTGLCPCGTLFLHSVFSPIFLVCLFYNPAYLFILAVLGLHGCTGALL